MLLDENGELKDYVNIMVNGVTIKSGENRKLSPGDEVAIFPPVSGGDIMKEVTPFSEALSRFLDLIKFSGVERVDVIKAHGRIVAENVISPIDVPHYNRAAMDGYAVISTSTVGASTNNPVILELSNRVSYETCVYVNTGEPLPEGADAVIKVEDTDQVGNMVEIYKPMRAWENVGKRGEDVSKGDVVIDRGKKLRASEIAMLKSLGIKKLSVARKPYVLVVPTGNELIQNGELKPGMVYESNGVMITAYLREWGAMPVLHEIVRDMPGKLEEVFKENAEKFDLLVFTGGTSAGKRDRIAEVLDEVGEVIFRGVAIRPGKPTIAGYVNSTPVLCLPGFPAACAVSAYAFLRPAIMKMLGVTEDWTRVRGVLTEKIPSKIGYRTYARVFMDFATMEVRPLMTSGASILSSMVKANGFVVIPERLEGYKKGDMVEVELFKSVID
jgi:molybdopterin molybdotransferase